MEWNKQQKFSIRKLTVGVISLIIGQFFIGRGLDGAVASADELAPALVEEGSGGGPVSEIADHPTETTADPVTRTSMDSSDQSEPTNLEHTTVETTTSPSAVASTERSATPETVSERSVPAEPASETPAPSASPAPAASPSGAGSGVNVSTTDSSVIPASTYDLDLRGQDQKRSTSNANEIAKKLLEKARANQPEIETKQPLSHLMETTREEPKTSIDENTGESSISEKVYTIIEDVDGKLKYKEGVYSLADDSLVRVDSEAEPSVETDRKYYDKNQFLPLTNEVATKIASEKDAFVKIVTKAEVERYIQKEAERVKRLSIGHLRGVGMESSRITDGAANTYLGFDLEGMFNSDEDVPLDASPSEVIAKRVIDRFVFNDEAVIRPVAKTGEYNSLFTFESWDKKSFALDLIQDQNVDSTSGGRLSYNKIDFDTRNGDKLFYIRASFTDRLGQKTTHVIKYKVEWLDDETPNPLMEKGTSKAYRYKVVAYNGENAKVYESSPKTVNIKAWDMIVRDPVTNQLTGATYGYDVKQDSGLNGHYTNGKALNVVTGQDRDLVETIYLGRDSSEGYYDSISLPNIAKTTLMDESNLDFGGVRMSVNELSYATKDYSFDTFKISASRKGTLDYETVVTSVPFKTEIRENSNLPKGIRNVVQFGQPGEERVIYSYDKGHHYYGNKHFSEYYTKEVSRERIKEPVNAIIEVGTQEKWGVKQLLMNKGQDFADLMLEDFKHSVEVPEDVTITDATLKYYNGKEIDYGYIRTENGEEHPVASGRGYRSKQFVTVEYSYKKTGDAEDTVYKKSLTIPVFVLPSTESQDLKSQLIISKLTVLEGTNYGASVYEEENLRRVIQTNIWASYRSYSHAPFRWYSRESCCDRDRLWKQD